MSRVLCTEFGHVSENLLSSAYYGDIFDMICLQLRARDELLGITDGVRVLTFIIGLS